MDPEHRPVRHFPWGIARFEAEDFTNLHKYSSRVVEANNNVLLFFLIFILGLLIRTYSRCTAT